MHLEDYEFYDEHVESVENGANVGNDEIYVFQLNNPTTQFTIHKDDVIQLAKFFGLAVYERKSEL